MQVLVLGRIGADGGIQWLKISWVRFIYKFCHIRPELTIFAQHLHSLEDDVYNLFMVHESDIVQRIIIELLIN